LKSRPTERESYEENQKKKKKDNIFHKSRENCHIRQQRKTGANQEIGGNERARVQGDCEGRYTVACLEWVSIFWLGGGIRG